MFLLFVILCLSKQTLERIMIDLMCIDCGAEFYEDALIDCKCPECSSSHYYYYDEVMEDEEDCNDRYSISN